MPADAPRQVFRPAPPNYVIGWVLAAFFGAPRPGFGAGRPGRGRLGRAGDRGGCPAAACGFLHPGHGHVGADSDPGGTGLLGLDAPRLVEWTEILSFRVGRGRSRGGWPAVIITLNNGTLIRTEVAAYRRSYPARIAVELTALQRQYAPAPPSSGSDSEHGADDGGVGRSACSRWSVSGSPGPYRAPGRCDNTLDGFKGTPCGRAGPVRPPADSAQREFAGVPDKPRHRLPP